MKKTIAYISMIIVVSCQNESMTEYESGQIDKFKIIIEDDSTSNGTRSRYTLTNNSFEHRYLKDKLMPTDTVMQEQENIEPNAKLKKISSYDINDLNQTEMANKNKMKFTLIKNAQSKTVQIGDNPSELICEVVSYINELSVEKYQLDLGCKK